MNDLISRQAAIDALHMHLMYRMGTDSNKKRLDEWINNLPPAQPETNCSEIPNGWIPIKAHPATEEERESCPDIDYWLDCEMPDDGQEILVTVKHKNWIGVEKDVCYVDSEYSLESGYDWDDIIAWMPLPEPYKEEEEE